MEYLPDFNDQWVEFMDKHNSITHLHANLGWKTCEPGLVELTTKLPNLVELTIYFNNNDLQTESIKRVIDTHNKLQKIRFHPDFYPENKETILEEAFGSEWHVESYAVKCSYTDKKGFLLTRKNSQIEEH